jgi:hypothetical protein
MMPPVTADEKDGCREWAFLGILSREIVEGRGERVAVLPRLMITGA